ncbi:F-box protein PP2-B10-like [Magnolia sinica]|uniref:F-box protein PP2-B10-like n=1 Tax=Magnolia sinica TaxID=86752 RepID=UPI00265A2179|nr:F-box protein PP2-B10-like [Magnolia sinica]
MFSRLFSLPSDSSCTKVEIDDPDRLFSRLPEGCISHILSYTTPRDACRSSTLSHTFKFASESDTVWEKFLPSDCSEILSKSVNPVEFSSKKELYFRLCDPILINGGKMRGLIELSRGVTKSLGLKSNLLSLDNVPSVTFFQSNRPPGYNDYDRIPAVHSLYTGPNHLQFNPKVSKLFTRKTSDTIATTMSDSLPVSSFSIEKTTGKKCFMLSARELSIVWGDTPSYWNWMNHPQSRFAEVAVLNMVCWLEIHGLIDSCMLSPKTRYSAYFVMGYDVGSYGLESPPAEVSVRLGELSKHFAFLQSEENRRNRDQPLNMLNHHPEAGNATRVPLPRSDGWSEIELGDCYNDEGDEGVVKMSLLEVAGRHWKAGIIIEGIEIRPKV